MSAESQTTQESTEPAPPEPESKSPDGSLIMKVQPGESVTDFQARARKRFAFEGDVFDFAYWLRENARFSVDAQTHDSWGPYRKVVGARENAITQAE